MSGVPTQQMRPRLLVVDDQSIYIQTLFHIFQDDHEVFMATSGQQALDFCAAHRPDLVLLDVLMPQMDGHEVCRQLKANPLTRDIPVIFVTSQTDPAEETLGLQLGAVDFITKPVNSAVVRTRVQAQLALRNTLAQVRELNATLEQRVAQRTQELESALQRLQEMHQSLASSEAKATLSTLAASASHELGTPLGNSMMAAGALSDQARRFQQMVQDGALKRSELSSFVETLLEGSGLIESNLHRANALLKNFRQVAADQASEQRRIFDLRAAVTEIVHAMSPTLKRHSHHIEIAIDEGIEMDSQPGPLGQVVINLINNAYLHAFEGRTSGCLTISATLHDDLVEMRFCDDGVGIAPEHLDKLFLPFFSTKIGQGGTGLGMAIVQNLVTQTLFGRIAVQSTLGKGTCFQLTLPRVFPTA